MKDFNARKQQKISVSSISTDITDIFNENEETIDVTIGEGQNMVSIKRQK